jgi:hypothetical protein
MVTRSAGTLHKDQCTVTKAVTADILNYLVAHDEWPDSPHVLLEITKKIE